VLLRTMRATKQQFDQLRNAGAGEPEEFARVFQAALLSDFEWTLDYARTQKLVLKRKSSKWIVEVQRYMTAWLAKAPLKGKRISQIRHHLNVCYAIQQLLEVIDRESSQLCIWTGNTADLMRALFSSIERRRYKEEEAMIERLANGGSGKGIKDAEFDRRELRRQCDYV